MADHDERDDQHQTSDQDRHEANAALGTGLGIGAFGAASAVLLGATCPLCVIASPALIGYGIYKRAKLSRAERNDCEAAATNTGSEPAGAER
jgi:hypothetical protein